ncbi:MAG: hypothetical protein R3F43_09945 [bacterium]
MDVVASGIPKVAEYLHEFRHLASAVGSEIADLVLAACWRPGKALQHVDHKIAWTRLIERAERLRPALAVAGPMARPLIEAALQAADDRPTADDHAVWGAFAANVKRAAMRLPAVPSVLDVEGVLRSIEPPECTDMLWRISIETELPPFERMLERLAWARVSPNPFVLFWAQEAVSEVGLPQLMPLRIPLLEALVEDPGPFPKSVIFFRLANSLKASARTRGERAWVIARLEEAVREARKAGDTSDEIEALAALAREVDDTERERIDRRLAELQAAPLGARDKANLLLARALLVSDQDERLPLLEAGLALVEPDDALLYDLLHLKVMQLGVLGRFDEAVACARSWLPRLRGDSLASIPGALGQRPPLVGAGPARGSASCRGTS